jgi:hypothetical protein
MQDGGVEGVTLQVLHAWNSEQYMRACVSVFMTSDRGYM